MVLPAAFRSIMAHSAAVRIAGTTADRTGIMRMLAGKVGAAFGPSRASGSTNLSNNMGGRGLWLNHTSRERSDRFTSKTLILTGSII